MRRGILTIAGDGDIFAVRTVVNAPRTVLTVGDVSFRPVTSYIIEPYRQSGVTVGVANFSADVSKHVNNTQTIR